MSEHPQPTEEQPPTEEDPHGGVSPEDLAKYENSSGIDASDKLLVAHFAKSIGNELYTVDSRNVGGSSNKALKLDDKKIFSNIPHDPSPPPVPVASSPAVVTNQPSNTVLSTRSAPPPPPTADYSDLDKRLTNLESAVRTLRKAKRIKRGVEYSVSSNSLKGVIKDASLLAEYVISEVAKGVKTITIKSNDCKNPE